MILIGLTGGIACGKSTVSRLLSDELHIEIIDADLIVRELQAPNAPCTRRIAARWPGCVDAQTGELNRLELGKAVFGDARARRELGKIMNPAIFRAILSHIVAAWWRDLKRTASGAAPSVVVLDAPTLFETNTFTYFVSGAVVVACTEERQIERMGRRNGFSREEALQRIHSQMPLSRKRQLADYVIDNDAADDLESLRGSVRASAAWMARQSNARLTCLFGAVAAAVTGALVAVGYAACRLLLA